MEWRFKHEEKKIGKQGVALKVKRDGDWKTSGWSSWFMGTRQFSIKVED